MVKHVVKREHVIVRFKKPTTHIAACANRSNQCVQNQSDYCATDLDFVMDHVKRDITIMFAWSRTTKFKSK
jgi:hypothetical protein